MANRYWRGGTGTWSAGTGNWSSASSAAVFTASRALTTLTVTAVTSGTIAVGQTVWHTNGTAIGTITGFGTGSGGVGTYTMSSSGTLTSRTMSSAAVGASAPTSSDDVIFDADSNVGTATFTVTTSGGLNCKNFTVSGLDAVMTLAGAATIYIAGSLAFPASNLTNSFNGDLAFTSAGSTTITTNGVALASNLSFTGAGPFTLGSALSTTGNLAISSGVTFNSANYSIASAIPNFDVASTVSLGSSSYIVTTTSGSFNAYLGDASGGTFTFNLNASSANSSVTGCGVSLSGVVIAGTGTATTFSFLGSSAGTGYTNNWGAVSSTKTTSHTVQFEEPNFDGTISPLVQHNFTNFNLSGTSGNQLTLKSYTTIDGSGAAAKMVQASGTVSVSYNTISKLAASGGASWQAYTRNGNIDNGGNSGWQFSFVAVTSGVLLGQGSTASGAGLRRTPAPHPTSGSLFGAGSSIAGTSLRSVAHGASGVLAGAGSSLLGIGSHNAIHASSGSLFGQGSAIAGQSNDLGAFSLSGPTLRYADFFRLTTSNGVYLFSTAPFAITVPSVSPDPFTALGQLVKVGGAQRDIKSTANETTITMIGIDTAMLGIVLAEKIKGSKIELWHGFFDNSNQLITPTGTGLYQYFSGYVNTFSISEEWMEEARSFAGAITISASSFQLILQNRTSGRYTNDAAWKAVNPTDTSMNRVNFISTINYAFGKTPT